MVEVRLFGDSDESDGRQGGKESPKILHLVSGAVRVRGVMSVDEIGRDQGELGYGKLLHGPLHGQRDREELVPLKRVPFKI